jgi:hypothetical protein
MSESDSEPLDYLKFQGYLPLQLLPLTDQLSDTDISDINRQNELYLNALKLLTEKIETDETDQYAQEIKRIDQKLSIVIDLLTDILHGAKVMPDMHFVELTTETLKADLANQQLASSHKVLISLYLDKSLPKPITFYATNLGSDNTDNFSTFKLESVSHAVKDALERFIFRYHRRKIAELKTK